MPIEITMPALSPTMTEGTLARWLKQEGDRVAAGDVIAEIETDKATMEVEAVDEGTLARILVPEGSENVAVNTPIAVLAAEGEDPAQVAAGAGGAGTTSQGQSETGHQLANQRPDNAATGEKPDNGAGAVGAGAGVEASILQRPADQVDTPRLPAALVWTPPDSDEDRFFGSTTRITVREALRDAMAEEMRADPKVFVMGEEVAEYQGAYKVTQNLLQEFGAERVIDTPITEHGFAGLGVGAAFAGLRPVVEFMTMNFAMQAIDQIINSAAKTLYMSGGQLGCPIVFRGPNGAAARVAAQHSQCYASWYAHCPGLKVVSPWSAADAKGLLKAAIRDPNPVIFLENEILYGRQGDVPTDPDFIVPIGRAKVVRAGGHVTIAAFSRMVEVALAAAEQLAADGIEAEVIDLRTIRPLDTQTLVASVRKTNRIVTVEEGWPFAGIGSEIAAVMMEQAFDWLDAPVTRVTGADVPLPYAANLEALALPQAEGVVRAARAVLYR